ncbi:hypothetical protein AAJ76_2910001082 [Vairimorpha ceranae]|uniref:Uncharacterized protein n=1 Tax=Vairimorpha ceranae TaxID=40302 RepID=A0A0F9W7C1_9MICR|nr:hypothetical protein AAJ76_2910001082 [Vairimorpha ceranae]KKO73701.1 hypothetical protein AAJ76_2910001082 [Vairimorpha ceranae]
MVCSLHLFLVIDKLFCNKLCYKKIFGRNEEKLHKFDLPVVKKPHEI